MSVAVMPPSVADARKLAHHPAGMADVSQLKLHHNRRDRRQQRGRDEHREAGEDKDADGTGAAKQFAGPPHRRQHQRRGDGREQEGGRKQPARVNPVGEPATGPRPVRDGAQRDPDHCAARLQSDAEVRADQPEADHLEYQDRTRGQEYGSRRHPIGESSAGLPRARPVNRVNRYPSSRG